MLEKFANNPNNIRPRDMVNTLNLLISGYCNLWNLEPWAYPPPDAEEGTLVTADGVNWNPGQGYGTYLYLNGKWQKITTGFIKARAYRNAAFTVPGTNTLTPVPLDSVSFDPSGVISNGQITPNQAGYYQISGQVAITNANTASSNLAYILKNGTGVSRGDTYSIYTAGGFWSFTTDDLIYANGSTDYFQLGFMTNCGTSSVQTLQTGFSFSNFLSVVGPF